MQKKFRKVKKTVSHVFHAIDAWQLFKMIYRYVVIIKVSHQVDSIIIKRMHLNKEKNDLGWWCKLEAILKMVDPDFRLVRRRRIDIASIFSWQIKGKDAQTGDQFLL